MSPLRIFNRSSSFWALSGGVGGWGKRKTKFCGQTLYGLLGFSEVAPTPQSIFCVSDWCGPCTSDAHVLRKFAGMKSIHIFTRDSLLQNEKKMMMQWLPNPESVPTRTPQNLSSLFFSEHFPKQEQIYRVLGAFSLHIPRIPKKAMFCKIWGGGGDGVPEQGQEDRGNHHFSKGREATSAHRRLMNNSFFAGLPLPTLDFLRGGLTTAPM